MSWFTVEAKTTNYPTCPRCRGAAFAVLVKRGLLHDIYDCKKCGVVQPKAKT